MMEGLGFQAAAFDEDEAWMHEAARRYRDLLRHRATHPTWQAGVALLTVFVEGSVNERAQLDGTHVRPDTEDAVRDHSLVKHYGCPPEAMELTRAHVKVEGGHRADAWRIVLEHVPPGSQTEQQVVATCEEALAAWHTYRDGVAERMQLHRA